MRTLIQVLSGVAVMANAVVYGTDVFGAIILRPAVAGVDDRTLTQSLGNIHRIADRRFPPIGVIGLLATIAAAAISAATSHWPSTVAAGVASLCLIAFLVVYSQISAPVNATLTEGALADTIPTEVRALQARWNSVINARVLLQGTALAGLCVSLAAA